MVGYENRDHFTNNMSESFSTKHKLYSAIPINKYDK